MHGVTKGATNAITIITLNSEYPDLVPIYSFAQENRTFSKDMIS